MLTADKSPGGIISTALGGAEGGENMLQKLMNGAGKMDFSSMLGKGMEGLKNLLGPFIEKILSFFQKGDLRSLGNDASQTLTRDMAQITGTNPSIIEVSPNGATRDLGHTADMGFDPQGMDRNPVAQPKLATPGISTPRLGMNGPS
jgi:hypothetical protein